MKETFKSDASRLAWESFKHTGKIGYYLLYAHIENPPKELMLSITDDKGMEQ